ncbi:MULTISPECIES: hypothetical protein [Campylobacter]|uniref:hypothetical protein n=1 Tax=Campylobacter TaxID=194 RepID=UPI0008736FEB|nr:MULTISPECIES: hypothetical protein [Campylobacter]EAK0768222.1 hypothetical protein [Campylobacter lari]EDP6895656.1 hypothetical protein [Campylobacter lari]EJV5920768.1 hypothetical protein [Campylobacter lari]MCV3399089.1 hypothetical protein [Campylobacter lari]MCV3414597.1 hypothetical protein [Campylobacter lari]
MYLPYFLNGKEFKHPIVFWKNIPCKICKVYCYVEFTALQKEISFQCKECKEHNVLNLNEL